MRIAILFFAFFMSALSVFANIDEVASSRDSILINEQTIQNRIDKCAFKILNANKIEKRVVFVYDNVEKQTKLSLDSASTLTKRQVVVYAPMYKFLDSEDELAAYLAREISLALRTYDGICNGFLRSLQVGASPKKFEIVADKRAVDYMVNSGYNPIALIIHIQKSSPQRRFDKISNHNLTSKRLAIIYEYIYTKYPYYLKNNVYLNNEYYQNFLLTSQTNRSMFEQKIKTGSGEILKYE